MVSTKKIVRVAKKIARKVRGKAIKRYFKKGYSPKLNQMYSDVMKMKRIINAEKKNFNINSGASGFVDIAQVAQNVDGGLQLDLTPKPAVGPNDNQRNGDSIKVVSGKLTLKFIQQPNTIQQITIIAELYYIVKPITNLFTEGVQLLYTASPITGGTLYDTNSYKNQDYLSLFQLVARRRFIVGKDLLAGHKTEKEVSLNLSINKGFGKHIKFNNNTTTNSVGQYVMFLRANRGNKDASVSSTITNISDTGPYTGLHMSYNMTWYYYDN